MSRTGRAQLARETISILEHGHYVLAEDRHVDFQPELRTCLEGTTAWKPRQLEMLVQTALTGPHRYTATEIELSNETTLAGARRLVESGEYKHVAALNFASAKNPGGGFLSGAQAQEESLARSSALYPSLLRGKDYYSFHRQQESSLYSDHMIWSPRCPVIRDDSGTLLEKPYRVSFITSPAPNAGAVAANRPGDVTQIPVVLALRSSCVLALAHHHEVDALVLGAWGCGVFRNDPVLVANIFAAAFRPEGKWQGRFRKVLFSVLDTSNNQATYHAFEQALQAS